MILASPAIMSELQKKLRPVLDLPIYRVFAARNGIPLDRLCREITNHAVAMNPDFVASVAASNSEPKSVRRAIRNATAIFAKRFTDKPLSVLVVWCNEHRQDLLPEVGLLVELESDGIHHDRLASAMNSGAHPLNLTYAMQIIRAAGLATNKHLNTVIGIANSLEIPREKIDELYSLHRTNPSTEDLAKALNSIIGEVPNYEPIVQIAGYYRNLPQKVRAANTLEVILDYVLNKEPLPAPELILKAHKETGFTNLEKLVQHIITPKTETVNQPVSTKLTETPVQLIMRKNGLHQHPNANAIEAKITALLDQHKKNEVGKAIKQITYHFERQTKLTAHRLADASPHQKATVTQTVAEKLSELLHKQILPQLAPLLLRKN